MNQIQVSVDGISGTFPHGGGMVSFGSDNHTNVIFYMKSVLDPVRSRQEGRPFYISKEYVRIQQPGEQLNVIDRPVADDPRVIQRWPNHYQKFQNNNQQDMPEGTPLEILFPNAPEIPANLHTQAVHTVEQLSNLTAHALQSIGMGSVEWQGMARRFLDSAKGGMEHHRLTKQVEDLQGQNQVLQNQISLMQSQLNRLTASQLQGIPQHMIPNTPPTQAQQYNAQFENPTNLYVGPFDNQVTHNITDPGHTHDITDLPPLPKHRKGNN